MSRTVAVSASMILSYSHVAYTLWVATTVFCVVDRFAWNLWPLGVDREVDQVCACLLAPLRRFCQPAVACVHVVEFLIMSGCLNTRASSFSLTLHRARQERRSFRYPLPPSFLCLMMLTNVATGPLLTRCH